MGPLPHHSLAVFPPQRFQGDLGVAKHNHSEGANTMIMERGARPDAVPKPKRGRTALIAVLGITVGLVLGLAALSLR